MDLMIIYLYLCASIENYWLFIALISFIHFFFFYFGSISDLFFKLITRIVFLKTTKKGVFWKIFQNTNHTIAMNESKKSSSLISLSWNKTEKHRFNKCWKTNDNEWGLQPKKWGKFSERKKKRFTIIKSLWILINHHYSKLVQGWTLLKNKRKIYSWEIFPESSTKKAIFLSVLLPKFFFRLCVCVVNFNLKW